MNNENQAGGMTVSSAENTSGLPGKNILSAGVPGGGKSVVNWNFGQVENRIDTHTFNGNLTFN